MANVARVQQTVMIRAERDRVWSALTGDANFRNWVSVFKPGSYFVGDWSKGSQVKLLDENKNGMIAIVKEHVPGEHLKIEHVGIISNGNEIFEGDAVNVWTPMVEEYSVSKHEGGYELAIDVEVPAFFLDHFEEGWGKALIRIKELAESPA